MINYTELEVTQSLKALDLAIKYYLKTDNKNALKNCNARLAELKHRLANLSKKDEHKGLKVHLGAKRGSNSLIDVKDVFNNY